MCACAVCAARAACVACAACACAPACARNPATVTVGSATPATLLLTPVEGVATPRGRRKPRGRRGPRALRVPRVLCAPRVSLQTFALTSLPPPPLAPPIRQHLRCPRPQCVCAACAACAARVSCVISTPCACARACACSAGASAVVMAVTFERKCVRRRTTTYEAFAAQARTGGALAMPTVTATATANLHVCTSARGTNSARHTYCEAHGTHGARGACALQERAAEALPRAKPTAAAAAV
eukprot:6186213-Pleurochrysis_carterae.AAC.10